MNTLKATLFDKPDEMEMAISHQAMNATWTIINIIFIIMVIVAFVGDNINPISLVFILAAEGIYFVIKSFLKWRMTRGGADK